ncbi:hypothetical protein [Mesorhizobium sp. J8]|nr:hypothetical protein [Mesorhizobium sp. J8]
MMRLLLLSGKERGSVSFVPPFAEKDDPLEGVFKPQNDKRHARRKSGA